MIRRPGILFCLVLSACSPKAASTPAGPARLSPTEITLDFQFVAPGTTSMKTVEYALSGAGAIDLTVDPTTLPEGFTVTGTGILQAGSGRTLNVVFAPTAQKVVRGHIVILAPGTEEGRAIINVRGVGTPDGVITDPAGCLDFGQVRIGGSRTLPVVVSNPVDSPQSYHVVSDDPAFLVVPDAFDLAPNGAQTLQVTFRPATRGAFDGPHLHFTYCSSCDEARRWTCGTGEMDSMKLGSSSLDFGNRSVGFTSCEDVTVTNDGDLPMQFAAISGDDAFDAGGFVLDTGTLLDGVTQVLPKAAASLWICFTPKAHGKDAVGVVTFASTGGARAELQVHGKGDPGGLVVTPSSIDFGITTPTAPITRHLVIENGGGPASLMLKSVALDAPDDALALAFPDGNPLNFQVGQTDFHVDVVFGPSMAGDHARSLLIRGVRPGDVEESISIPLSGTGVDGEVCQLSVEPGNEVRFGLVHAGVPHDQLVRITNLSTTEACKMWGFGLDPQGSAAYELLGAPAEVSELAPGGVIDLTVRYTPRTGGITLDTSTLSFARVAAVGQSPVLKLAVSGLASALDISAPGLDFGAVPVGAVKWLPVNLENHSSRLVKVGNYGSPATDGGDVVLSQGSSPAFRLADLPTRLPATLAAGGQLTFSAAFAPAAAGPATGQLEVWLSHALAPIVIPLSGIATSDPCGEACTPPEAVCPTSLDGYVHGAVTLQGAAHQGGDELPCQWEVAGAPGGSTATLDPVDSCRPVFRPDVPGDYTFRLTAGSGPTDSCLTTLHAVVYAGLWVELSWSNPDDLDLHFFHPLAGDVTSARSWFSLPYDCTYANQTPFWDAATTDDDPVLVRDDEYGTGPEEVRLAAPSTDHDYEIGAHWFSSYNRNKSQSVVTRVYCGGQQVAEVQDSLDMVYQAVDVGSVQWHDDGTCTFQRSGFKLTLIP